MQQVLKICADFPQIFNTRRIVFHHLRKLLIEKYYGIMLAQNLSPVYLVSG